MKITIEDYNPDWKIQFVKERKLLLVIFADVNVVIEHIGSTAIEGLGAKPVIDIMIGLEDFKLADSLIPEVEKLGYEYISKYEDLFPYRRFFTKKASGKSTHNIHMVKIGSEFWRRHLLFRDHLRRNQDDRDKYYKLKRELAKQDWKDGNEYADAKSEFIRAIENKAL